MRGAHNGSRKTSQEAAVLAGQELLVVMGTSQVDGLTHPGLVGKSTVTQME